MIIRLFRKKFFSQYLALLLFTILLWLDVLVYPEMMPGLPETYGQQWLNLFISSYPRLAIGISIFLLLVQALLLNQILEHYRLIERNQLVAAAMYIMIMSNIPAFVQPNIFILVNFLMIVLLNRMFALAGKPEPLSIVFDTGILVGIASILYFPLLYLLLFVWLGMMVYQIFNWRSWLISILAFLTPYLFAAVWCFMHDSLDVHAVMLLDHFSFVSPGKFQAGPYFYVILSLLFILLLTGIGIIVKNITENTIEVRKHFRVLILFSIFGAGCGLFSGALIQFHLLILAVPFVAFLGLFLTKATQYFWSDILLALIIISILSGKLIHFL